MLTGIGFALVGLSALSILLGPDPKLQDYIDRPAYAARQNARWALRAFVGQVLSLTGCIMLLIAFDWLGRMFIVFALVVGYYQLRRLRRQRRTWIAKAVAYEDEEIARTPVPDSPPDLL